MVQCYFLFLCLGATLHGLVMAEHPTSKELLNTLIQDWESQVTQVSYKGRFETSYNSLVLIHFTMGLYIHFSLFPPFRMTV